MNGIYDDDDDDGSESWFDENLRDVVWVWKQFFDVEIDG